MESTFPSDDDDHRPLLIPGDVLIQILVWLPVISLLRFKSVCKSWRALIESSFFIHLHATLPSSSSKFGTFIFETSPYDTTETRFFMLTYRSGGGGEDEVFEVEDLEFPPFYKTTVPVASTNNIKKKLAMVGSCNGLICLHDSTKLQRRGGDVSLWNPATRQFRLLPKSLTLEEEEEEEEKINFHVQDVLGFGFDVKTKDYKVVQITSYFHHVKAEFVLRNLRVQVYSLSSNSWRVLEGDGGINSLFPVQRLFMKRYGVYLSGSYFFKGVYGIEDRICHWVLSFDFTKEIFTIMQFPNNHDPGNALILTSYYFGEKKLASVSRGKNDDDDQSNLAYDIWVLNIEHDDQEEEESYYWTKLQHSIRIRKTKEITWQTTMPRFISNDGEFALIQTRCGIGATDCKLQLFNLVTKEEKTVFSTGMELRRADVYKPSLVSIVGGGNENGTAAATAADWGDLGDWW